MVVTGSDNHMRDDMAKGFGHFVDEVMRGRDSKIVLNSSIGLAALEIGVPSGDALPTDVAAAVMNNRDMLSPGNWGSGVFEGNHPLFDLSSDNLTLFGLDFNDMFSQMGQWWEGADIASEHHTPIYDNTLAESIGLPDLPYGELAHFAHMGLALYDSGRTFQDLWNEPALKHNVLKIMTHPEMVHTLLFRGTMLTVMGLLHPLGPLVAIGTAYLCAHLVHSAFKLLEGHKDAVREIENVPVLKHIYNATGIKEWAQVQDTETDLIDDEVDPFEEMPELRVAEVQHNGAIDPRALLVPKPV